MVRVFSHGPFRSKFANSSVLTVSVRALFHSTALPACSHPSRVSHPSNTSQPCKGVKHLPVLPMMVVTSVCLSPKGFNKKKKKTIWDPSASEVTENLWGSLGLT